MHITLIFLDHTEQTKSQLRHSYTMLGFRDAGKFVKGYWAIFRDLCEHDIHRTLERSVFCVSMTSTERWSVP